MQRDDRTIGEAVEGILSHRNIEEGTSDTLLYEGTGARLERWIGGIYNWETKHWVWGATGEDLVHQGFSRQNPNTDHKWHCIMMDPTNYYRWNAKSCVHKKHYICETPLKKVRKKGNKKLARKQKKNTNINKFPPSNTTLGVPLLGALELRDKVYLPADIQLGPTQMQIKVYLLKLIQENVRVKRLHLHWSRLSPDPARSDWTRIPASQIQPDSRAYTGHA
uniref:C-type lectin domain-containing protein n=1 Tax=Timema poppense TaxID=170557 RepID=A0A7R9CGM9_TIMPO|nr:unnamed protein product [Timema poppensis]